MKKRKAFALWLLAAALCLAACAPAYASPGRFVYQVPDGMMMGQVLPAGNGFFIISQENGNTNIRRYGNPEEEPEIFVLEEPDWEDGEDFSMAAGDIPETETEDDDPEDEEEDSFFLNIAGQKAADAGPEAEQGPEPAPYGTVTGWFSLDDEIYAVHEEETFDGTDVFFRPVKLSDGKAVLERGSLPKPDNRELVGYDEESGECYCKGLGVYWTIGKYLIGWTSADDEEAKLLVFDLEDGSCRDRSLGAYERVVPGPQDYILIVHTEDVRDKMNLTFSRLDPEDGREEALAEIAGMEQGVVLCFDPGLDTLYYIAGTKVRSVPQMDTGRTAEIGDFPSDTTGDAIILANGDMLITSDTFAAVYDTGIPAGSASVSTEMTVKVRDFTHSDTVARAAGEMNARQEGIRVDVKQENTYGTDLLKMMLNRDAGTDVFVMQYGLSEYKALRDRGYVTDLGGNRQIAENTGRMHPYIREAVTRDGKIIAIPIGVSRNAVSIDLRVWEKLGGTETELPRTWGQFFAWLGALPERTEGTGVNVTGSAGQEFRAGLIGVILESYQTWMEESKGMDYSFNTPVLNGLLERLDGLDFEVLAPETGDGYTETLLTFDDGSPDRTVPLQLAFEEGGKPVVPVSLTAAFINPYSEHPEEAKEFLARVLEDLDLQTQYALYGDKTEPVERQDAKEQRDAYAEYTGQLQERIGKADDADRAILEETLRKAEKEWAEQEGGLWIISPEAVRRYREMLPALTVQDHLFLRDMVGTSENEEAMALYMGLYYGEGKGTQSLREMLAALDNQIRMKRLEGN